MKLYKVIKNNKAKNGGKFDYSEYLPNGKKKGKWTPTIKNIELCEKGYHVTPYWNMFYEEGSKIYEVEAKGMKKMENAVGVIEEYVCKSIRLVKEIKPKFYEESNIGYENTGRYNTGHRNTGNKNIGYRNTGRCNTGDYNTGDYNTGRYNTGDYNAGRYNTGDYNAGRYNTGDYNTGDYNTGDYNTGRYNTGDYNTGHCNTGNWNTGNRNTGDWNGKGGNYQTGCFNTKEPEYFELFNKPIARDKYKNIDFPPWLSFNTNWKDAFKKASKEEIQKTIELPNFDYKIFREITGITKKMILKKLGDKK